MTDYGNSRRTPLGGTADGQARSIARSESQPRRRRVMLVQAREGAGSGRQAKGNRPQAALDRWTADVDSRRRPPDGSVARETEARMGRRAMPQPFGRAGQEPLAGLTR